MDNKQEEIVEVDFILVEDRGHINTLICPNCHAAFDVDAHTDENLVWDLKQKAMVATCPACKARQK